MADVPRNPDGSYTLYDQDGMTVKLTFLSANPPPAGFKVVTKPVPGSGLPAGYTWIVNFGVQNKAGNYLPSVSYHLNGSPRFDHKEWYIYYNGQANAMNKDHTSPGDPPIGFG